MDVVFLLLIVAVIAVIAMAWIFIKALRSGQYDDLEGPAYRILMDDETETHNDNKNGNSPPKQ